ncbi:hypothetical protein Slin_5583 [Spirosoma linguale DSM 74]|uniref:Uncharacterized protein n=1 Tax=Spirosoma linguale (strain ATCC 33905 / DSM 74 / LMG 10896 / Claus 1) TaxID=504472 RepID=D2QRW6_SPILD|nr:hypothetical protein Slin_5583 [Spirosoma linguale DSM 74]
MTNSSPTHFRRLFGFLALLTIVYAGVEIYFAVNIWSVKNLIHFIPFALIVLYYKFGLLYDPINFDTQFFYPKNSHKKIPLSSIQTIKLTSLKNQFNYPYWRVIYLSDQLSLVRVLPPSLDDSFASFIDAVKKANPSVDTDIYEFKVYYGFLPGTFWKTNKN